MSATWTSSFTKINSNNETFESNIQQLLRTNGFRLKAQKYQNSSSTFLEDCIGASTNQNHYLENEIEEVHLQVTSRSVSSLQGQNIAEHTTVLKVYSKTTLKEDELTNKLPHSKTNAQKDATLSGKDEIVEKYDVINDKLRYLNATTDEKCVFDDGKIQKGQLPVKETKNLENRIVRNPLKCPELIELYFSKKDVASDKELSMRTFSKEENECCGSNSGDSVSFSGTNSNVAESCTNHDMKHAKSGSLNENSFEPTRDQRNTVNSNVDDTREKNWSNLNKECRIVRNKIEVDDRVSRTDGKVLMEKVDGKIELDTKENGCTSETVQLQKLCAKYEDSSVIDEATTLNNLLLDNENVRSNGNERKCNTENSDLNSAGVLLPLKNEKCANSKSSKAEDVVDNCKTVEESRENSDEKKANTKIDDCHQIENMNFSVFENTLLTRAEENQNTCLNSTFIKTDACKSDESAVKSNKIDVSKSLLKCEDLSSMESVTVIANEEKSSGKSLKENNISIVIEKRGNKKDNYDKDVSDDVKNNLFDKNVSSLIIDDEKEEIRDSRHGIAKIEAADYKDKIITQKIARINDDYKDMNICKMLTSIHEQLTCDLKRIKGIEAKLHGKVSANSSNHTMPLQLLDKTVTRCKSYIHGSNNSQKAESEIAKVISTYGFQLLTAVNKNKAALDQQEQCVNQMQTDALHGRTVNNKISVLKEINASWMCWRLEIVYLIEMISGLVKNVMDKNEEKENVKDPRKYKHICRHETAVSFVDYLKQRHKSNKSKPTKLNLFPKDNAVETQISAASNLQQTKSKTSAKLLNNVVTGEREKIQNDVRTSEKKTIYKASSRKESIRSKNRGWSNQQPVWRPGGIVKIPSSNSATALQKIRPNVKEKTNLLAEHTKTEKPIKTVDASKKKDSEFPSTENILLSMRTTLTSNSRNSKIVGKRSNTSLKISPRLKPRPGTLKATPRNYSEPVRQVLKHPNSKQSESKSSHDDALLRRSKESKPLCRLKDSTEDIKHIINHQLYGKVNGTALNTPSEAILVKAENVETSTDKKELTRDVDPNRFVENHPELSDTFHESCQTTETVPCESLDSSEKFKHAVKEEANPNLDKNRSKGSSNHISVIKENHVADFSSNPDRTARFEFPSRCRTSSPRYVEQKNEKGKLGEEKSTSLTKKSSANCHGLSLCMLKEFLCEQGIDVDLVNKAERKLKDKQKTRRYSKKKAVSFADMFFGVRDDQQLQKALNDERLWDILERKEENGIDRGDKLKMISHKDDDTDCEKSSKCTENVTNCETSLKHTENAVDCEKSSKYTECRRENDIDCEKSSKQEDECERSSRRTEYYIEDVIDCDTTLKRKENCIQHEKNPMRTENYERNVTDCEKCSTLEEISGGKVMNCENDLNYVESHKDDAISREEGLKRVENVINCERELRNSENNEARDINVQRNSKLEHIYNDNNVDCDKNLKYAGSHEENDIKHKKSSNFTEIFDDVTNCEASLKHVEPQKENNSSYENNFRFPKRYIGIDISPEVNLRYKENSNNCQLSIIHTEKHEECKVNCERDLMHAENQKECKINCESNLENKENTSNCGKDIKYTENYKDTSIHDYKNSRYAENDKGYCNHSADCLNYPEDHKENRNSDGNLHHLENDNENCINRERNLKSAISRNGSSINCDNRMNHIENNNHSEECLKRKENCSNKNNNCDTGSKHSENHIEMDIDCERNLSHTRYYQESSINYDSSLNYAGNHEESRINCDRSSNCAENYRASSIKCDRVLNYAKDHKGSNINYENRLKYVVNREGNHVNSDNSLKYVENLKESNINSKSSLNYAENDKESNINCDSSMRHAENHKESNINCDNGFNNSEYHKKRNRNCESNLNFPINHADIDINRDNLNHGGNRKCNCIGCENELEFARNPKEDNNNLIKSSGDTGSCRENHCGIISSHKGHFNCGNFKFPQPEMKDAASFIEHNCKDAYSQTNFQITDSKTWQSILQNNAPLKQLRVTETQTELYRARNTINESRNASSMTEALPVSDISTETVTVSFVSTPMETEVIDRAFSNNFNKKRLKKETRKSSKSVETTLDKGSGNSTKECDNFFCQLLNQMQESSFNREENDASNALRFVESDASTSTSGTPSEHERAVKHAHTSPIKMISSETMAALHVSAIRIRNIYRAIDIYDRKLRNELKKAEKRSKCVNKICKDKPSCVSKSSSVDTIFARKNRSDKSSVVRVLESLKQAEIESTYVCDNEQEDSESTKSSSTVWSYESTCGKVELKISGKLSDTLVLKDVGPLMEFLVQKTEDSIRKVQKIPNSSCTRLQDNETAQFSIFARENLLTLIYGVICSIVFWCLHFTITCDTVS